MRLWLHRKGFSPNKRYVFLFAKRGAPHLQKAHHFTSILTWRLLADKIRAETDIIPVAVGDDIGLKTSPSLVAFWDDQGWKDAFDGKPTRRDQLGLWAYFAQNYHSCSILGMRSGMIEVPALLGIRTRYIEERGNKQAERMESWLGKVPGWSRQIVERTPGIAQQKYMAEYKHTRQPTAEEQSRAAALRYTLPKSTIGTRSGQKFDQDAFRKKINAVFGDKPLEGETRVDPTQFMIRPGEFDEILNWIKQAPDGGSGATLRQPEPREDISMGNALEQSMAAMRERVAVRDWSEL